MINRKIELVARYSLWISFLLSILVWIVTGIPFLTVIWMITFLFVLFHEWFNLMKAMIITRNIAEETRYRRKNNKR